MNGKRFKRAGSLVILVILLTPFADAAMYSGGTGTENAPYQIVNGADWTTLTATSDDWDKYFILVENIDFDGRSLTPVGNTVTAFTGIFDGNGYRLSNGQINLPAGENVGLFGLVGSGGEVRNLDVETFYVVGDISVGGLAGRNNGMIMSCYASCTVKGRGSIGGLVGFVDSEGVVSSCCASCAVWAGIIAGGLVGENQHGIVENCYATGPVSTLSLIHI